MGHADRISCLNKMHLKFGVTEIVIKCITEQVGNDAMSSKCMPASNVKVLFLSPLRTFSTVVTGLLA